MKKHVRKVHSEVGKRKAEESAELICLELLHSDKVPTLVSDESQQGGAVCTRRMKKDLESAKEDLKTLKDEPRAVKRKSQKGVDMSDLIDEGMDDFLVERANRLELSENPLFKANLTFLPYKRQGLKGAVKKEQFTVTFDQLRKPTEEKSLGEGLSESLFEEVRETCRIHQKFI